MLLQFVANSWVRSKNRFPAFSWNFGGFSWNFEEFSWKITLVSWNWERSYLDRVLLGWLALT
jgi:hypothetical protein